MSRYVLYGGPITRAIICEMVLIRAGLDHELREIDLSSQEHREPRYKTIKPAGLVPSLITPDGQVLHETPAINLYLSERHRIEALAPAVHDRDRGNSPGGLCFISGELEPAFRRFCYPHRYIMRPEDEEDMRRHSFQWIMHLLDTVDLRLQQGGPFCLGNRFSLVDLTLAYWIGPTAGKRELSAAPAVIECCERVMQMEPFTDKFNELLNLFGQYEARSQGAWFGRTAKPVPGRSPPENGQRCPFRQLKGSGPV